MKKLFCLLFVLALSVGAYGATVTSVTENFDGVVDATPGSEDAFEVDRTAGSTGHADTIAGTADDELVLALDSGYTWGGFAAVSDHATDRSASGNHNTVWIRDGDSKRGSSMGANRGPAGSTLASRIYTKFDGSTTLDASGANAYVEIEISGNGGDDLVKVLITDGTDWYRSNDLIVSPTGKAVQMWRALSGDYANNFVVRANVADLTWSTVDTSASTPGADMDEVDAGGEIGPLTVTGAGTPTLSTIVGMGVESRSQPGGDDQNLLVKEMSIITPAAVASATSVTENCDGVVSTTIYEDGEILDNGEDGNDNETVFTLDSGFTWGAYAIDGPGAKTGANTEAWVRDADAVHGTSIGFNQDCMSSTETLNRVYTNFDGSTIIDVSAPGAYLEITMNAHGIDDVFALLLSDGDAWYQSEEIALPATLIKLWSPIEMVEDPIKLVLADLTWAEVDTSTGAGADMAEVDDGGETGALVTSYTGATPNLARIQGMGIAARSTMYSYLYYDGDVGDQFQLTFTEMSLKTPTVVTALTTTFGIEDTIPGTEEGIQLDINDTNDDETTSATLDGLVWGAFANGTPPASKADANTIWLRDGDTGRGGGTIANIGFNRDVMSSTGARFYTKFADKIVDVSGTGAVAEIDVFCNGEGDAFYLLLASGDSWYRSESIATDETRRLPWNPISTIPNLELSKVLADLDWTLVLTDAAGKDMNELDDGGETGELTAAVAMDPDFSTITGMGIEVADTGTTNHWLLISRIKLYSPSGSGVQDWRRY